MRSILTTAGAVLALLAMAIAIGPQKAASGDSPANPDTATAASAPDPVHQQDEKAIRFAAEAFVKAYNLGRRQSDRIAFRDRRRNRQ